MPIVFYFFLLNLLQVLTLLLPVLLLDEGIRKRVETVFKDKT